MDACYNKPMYIKLGTARTAFRNMSTLNGFSPEKLHRLLTA